MKSDETRHSQIALFENFLAAVKDKRAVRFSKDNRALHMDVLDEEDAQLMKNAALYDATLRLIRADIQALKATGELWVMSGRKYWSFGVEDLDGDELPYHLFSRKGRLCPRSLYLPKFQVVDSDGVVVAESEPFLTAMRYMRPGCVLTALEAA